MAPAQQRRGVINFLMSRTRQRFETERSLFDKLFLTGHHFDEPGPFVYHLPCTVLGR